MGRIQRKKSSAVKKKKKQAAESRPVAATEVVAQSGANTDTSMGAVAKAPPKRQPAAASQPLTKPKDNIFTKTAQFLREVKVELKKVAWPSRKQTIGSTAVVIALVVLISLFLGVVDFGISSLIRIVLQ